MPELPEVETIVRDLRPVLVGCTIRKVERDKEELRRPWERKWEKLLIGQKVKGMRRRGKWIITELKSDNRLVFHMGMTGQLTVASPSEARKDHTHLILEIQPGAPSKLSRGAKELRFRDVRRFGSATLFEAEAALESFFEESGLGPEPFDLELEAWRAELSRTKRAIKAVLLDQRVVAGVGNIYADEALFHAGVHPARASDELSAAEATRIGKGIVAVLTRAIEERGSTIRDYIGGSGLRGGYQDEFLAYGKAGQPCNRCRTKMKQARVAGRASHFCPACQKDAS